MIFSSKGLIAMVCLAACSPLLAANAAPDQSPATDGFQMVYQLAVEPIAIVDGDRCEVRGAVWANGPRPFVNVELVAADGTTHQARTNAVGTYSLSIAFAGTPTTYEERIADPIYMRTELADKARIYSPPIECSLERTAAFLKSIAYRSAK